MRARSKPDSNPAFLHPLFWKGAPEKLVSESLDEANGLGEDPFDLLEMLLGSCLDKVTIEVRPAGDRRIALKPYPFGVDPPRVVVPVRIIDSATKRSGRFTHGGTRGNSATAGEIELNIHRLPTCGTNAFTSDK